MINDNVKDIKLYKRMEQNKLQTSLCSNVNRRGSLFATGMVKIISMKNVEKSICVNSEDNVKHVVYHET